MRTLSLTQPKHTAQALEEVALGQLSPTPSDPHGYEKQVLVAMQLGLYVLHYLSAVKKKPCEHLLADASGKRCAACGEVRGMGL